MLALCFLVQAISQLIWFVIIVHVIMSWLITFNIVNMNNKFVYQLFVGLDGLLMPLLAPIRRFLPNLGGLDISPIILLIAVGFVERLITPYVCYV